MPPAIYRLMDNQWLHKPLIKAGYRVLGGIVSGITPGPVGIFIIYDKHMSQKTGTFHPVSLPGWKHPGIPPTDRGADPKALGISDLRRFSEDLHVYRWFPGKKEVGEAVQFRFSGKMHQFLNRGVVVESDFFLGGGE